MHQYNDSDLNVIKDEYPYLYELIKAESSKFPTDIPFEACATISNAMTWDETPQGYNFWSDLHYGFIWRRGFKNDFQFFLKRHSHIPDTNKIFTKRPEVYTNKYNLSYDPATGISTESDAFGVDFTTKKRIIDY
jgi:hypothetical protein